MAPDPARWICMSPARYLECAIEILGYLSAPVDSTLQIALHNKDYLASVGSVGLEAGLTENRHAALHPTFRLHDGMPASKKNQNQIASVRASCARVEGLLVRSRDIA